VIYLDSALVAEAQLVEKLGWVKGITTNPTLLAKSDLPVETTLKRLAQLSPGEVYYQLTASDFDGCWQKGGWLLRLLGSKPC
jgi:transaldolase